MSNLRPVHFEIHAADMDRVADFYTNVFGWKIDKMDMGEYKYYVVKTGEDDQPGINGGITKRMGDNPNQKEPTPVVGFVCTIEVEDIDKTIEKIKASGGIEALPLGTVPGVGKLAYYKDTESNIFGILQPEPNKKTG